MKSLYCLLALLFSVNFSYAQNTSWPSPTSGDNVGIGTVSPIEKTTVANADSRALGIYRDLDVTSVGPAGIFLNFGARNGNTFTPGAQISGILFNPATNGELDLSTLTSGSMTTKMIINSAGNVGIGTTSPLGKLHIYGTAILSGNTANIDPVSGPALNFLANTGQLLIGWNRTGGGGETDFISNQAEGNLGGFAFYNHDNSNSESKLLQILGNGQVLIGDTQNKQGDYKLAIAGSTIATSVTVKTVTNWPDYVFRPTYQLPKLSEVKSYIEQNQHLPEMPSEAEVKKDGVNLGEMNKLLVKKVEELTLYLIDLKTEKDKKDKEQQSQIDQLKQQVETLMKRTP